MTAAVFKIINARSCHIMPTTNQPNVPVKDNTWSYKAKSGLALIAIADKRINDATHFIYQSIVYLGVALLNIRFEFSISFHK